MPPAQGGGGRSVRHRRHDLFEGLCHVRRRLKPFVRGLFEQARHDCGERRGRGKARGQLRRIAREISAKGFEGAGAPERALASQHFVQRRAERKKIRACIDLLARRLLGRHVAGRAGDDAGQRLRPSRRCGCLQLRQSEVEQLHATIGPQEHVLRLQVAMDDATGVRGREAARYLQRDGNSRCCRQRSGLQTRAKALAFEIFADDERRATMFADVVDREDVRVVQRARRPSFARRSA